MPWVKLDDAFCEHDKFLRAGPLAGYLMIAAIAWSNRNLKDGIVPAVQVGRLVNFDGCIDRSKADPTDVAADTPDVSALDLAEQLVQAGLWERVRGGYRIHGIMPLECFEPRQRRGIELLVAQPRPPAKWVTICGGLAQVESRAWHGWYRARGKDPNKVREHLPDRLRRAIIQRDGYVCGLCGGEVQPGEVHIDHILPVSLGGTDNPKNLQVTHADCNIRKSNRVGAS